MVEAEQANRDRDRFDKNDLGGGGRKRFVAGRDRSGREDSSRLNEFSLLELTRPPPATNQEDSEGLSLSHFSSLAQPPVLQ